MLYSRYDQACRVISSAHHSQNSDHIPENPEQVPRFLMLQPPCYWSSTWIVCFNCFLQHEQSGDSASDNKSCINIAHRKYNQRAFVKNHGILWKFSMKAFMCKRRTKCGLYTSLNKTPRKPTTLFHIDQQWISRNSVPLRGYSLKLLIRLSQFR